MKKFIKCCFSLVLTVAVIFSFTACKNKLSKTTVNTDNVKSVNGVSTNGGITAVHGEYLYFINGTKTNDGTSSTGNKQSAICRVKFNAETGKVTDENSYEVVVSDLVGYEDGSIYFFGDFMYYATPCSDKNYKGEVLYNKTKFMRYDLVNKKSHEIYTTQQNNKDEVISYAYYVVGESLNLVVYEKTNATITSLKIDDKITTNYVIESVGTCVLSETNGKCVTAGKTVDANCYVFYTVSPIVDLENGIVDLPQEGVKVYRTSPTTNNSKLISNNGKEVTLVSIRSGKLVTAIGDIVYIHSITGSDTESLTFGTSNKVSYVTHENVIFMENSDGSISMLYYGGGGEDADSSEVAIVTWKDGTEIKYEEINVLETAKEFEFVTLATIEEVVVEDDKDTADVDETKKEKVQVLIYIADGIAYKLEIARENAEGEMVRTTYAQPIKLSTSSVQASSGVLVAEVIGNYLYAHAQDSDKNIYLHQIDLTITDDSTKKATKIAVNA